MLKGTTVILRALERDDLSRLSAFNNDVEVELAGGGDPPMPQSFARLQAEYEAGAGGGGRDDASFAIEVDGVMIGICALFNFDHTAHTCELGITIWGQILLGAGPWDRGGYTVGGLRLPAAELPPHLAACTRAERTRSTSLPSVWFCGRRTLEEACLQQRGV